MLILYVFGLPIIAYFFVWRLRVRAVNDIDGDDTASVNTKRLSRISILSSATARNKIKYYRKVQKRKSSMQQDNQFAILGLLFSVFSEETWFWEIIICWRKVILAAISVFGSQMGELQIQYHIIINYQYLLYFLLFYYNI